MTRKEQIIAILRNNEFYTCDWTAHLNKVADEILSLPLDVPSEEEIETESNKITYRNIPTFDTQRVAFRIAAKWAIKQIIERNQK